MEGITVCADCGAELVENLEEDKEDSLLSLMETEADDDILMEELAAGDMEEEGAGMESVRTARSPWHTPYQNSAQKAAENRSSAYMLLLIGVIGFILSLLVLLDVIPLYRNAITTKYFICGVMGALFLLFIIFGIVSMKNFKILSVKAESEDLILTQITKWCDENLSAAYIDEGLFGEEEIAEEQKYFRRADKMKQLIKEKYMNLEEEFLDHFVDDYYQNLF
ncbi:MAG: hypothetical protein NC434_04275 [Ruminococcus sp.]|nr:hypothetical protein [Ruminococcus sp.]